MFHCGCNEFRWLDTRVADGGEVWLGILTLKNLGSHTGTVDVRRVIWTQIAAVGEWLSTAAAIDSDGWSRKGADGWEFWLGNLTF